MKPNFLSVWQPVNMVMNTVALIATGGTIACTRDETGALRPTLNATELVEMSGHDSSVDIRCIDVRSLDSSSMTLNDVDSVINMVHSQLQDPQVCGVVVTHGTDSLVDTAFAVDLTHADPRPVVFTGAQRPADDPDPDGPANLRAAIDYASADVDAADTVDAATSLSKGVVVAFGGQVRPARGLVKAHTDNSDAFANTWELPVIRPDAIAPTRLAGLRIPVIAAWAGAGDGIIDAVVAAKPDGIVVEAMGSGNVSDQMGRGIARAVDSGVPVVITTAVPFGPVEFAYGGAGGGSTLGELGAIPSGWLRASQARIALATAISAGIDPISLIGA